MSAAVSQHELDVPGGRIYYETRGTGPVLLVVGQPMTSGPFGPLANLLADDYTVVTYDPRGMGGSTVDDLSLPVTPEVEADDLAAVVEAVGSGRADMFGSSGGAVAGLALAAHHPDTVGTVIAHEPPVTQLLPDAEHIRTVLDGIEDSYRAAGAGAAWGGFVSMVMHSGPITEDGVSPAEWPPPGMEPTEPEESGPPPEPSPKQAAEDELFFLSMLKPFPLYAVPVEALKSGSSRIVVAVGEASRGDIAARSAEALAARLGTEAVRFPGDHGGFMADPAGFASTIREVLSRPTR